MFKVLYRLLPLNFYATVLAKAQVDRVDGRKIYLTANLKSPDGKVTYATGTAMFLSVLDKKKVAAISKL